MKETEIPWIIAYEHCAIRAYERYGEILEPNDLDQIKTIIGSGRGKYLGFSHDSFGKEGDIWQIRYWNKDVIVVYRMKEDRITTFLPPPVMVKETKITKPSCRIDKTKMGIRRSDKNGRLYKRRCIEQELERQHRDTEL